MESFNEFSIASKIWVYPSRREITPSEAEQIKNYTREFISQWVSHGSPVKGTIGLLYNRFVVVVVDDSADRACGSSIDASVRFIKFLDEELKAGLLDRMSISFRTGNSIQTISLDGFEKLAQDGTVNENTIVFNSQVHTLQELKTAWEIPLGKSWLKKYLKKQSV